MEEVKIEKTGRSAKDVNYKAECKKLQEELDKIKFEFAAIKDFTEKVKMQKAELETTMNNMAMEYTRITEYIKDATLVYYRNILTILGEGGRK